MAKKKASAPLKALDARQEPLPYRVWGEQFIDPAT